MNKDKPLFDVQNKYKNVLEFKVYVNQSSMTTLRQKEMAFTDSRVLAVQQKQKNDDFIRL